MAVKTFNPTSPARRNMTIADYSSLTKKAPEKSLLVSGSSQADATLMVVSLFATSAAVIVVRSVSLTGRETKMVSRQQ